MSVSIFYWISLNLVLLQYHCLVVREAPNSGLSLVHHDHGIYDHSTYLRNQIKGRLKYQSPRLVRLSTHPR